MESNELPPPPEGASVAAQVPWLRTRIVNIEKRQLLVDERVGQLRKEITYWASATSRSWPR